jgi:hypothetical protein
VRWIRRTRQAIRDWLGPFWLGFIDSIGSVTSLTAAFLVLAASFSPADPEPDLFRDLAALGVALFIAYSVATGATGPSFKETNVHRNWLGASCGLGVAGFVAIAVSVALTAYREAGHAGTLDIVGLCWVAATLTLLGVFIAVLPAISSSWRDASSGD